MGLLLVDLGQGGRKLSKAACATCRHLKALQTGREFDLIVDTEYTTFHCDMFGWTVKEYYLMSPVSTDVSTWSTEKICEFWAEWTPVEEGTPRYQI